MTDTRIHDRAVNLRKALREGMRPDDAIGLIVAALVDVYDVAKRESLAEKEAADRAGYVRAMREAAEKCGDMIRPADPSQVRSLINGAFASLELELSAMADAAEKP